MQGVCGRVGNGVVNKIQRRGMYFKWTSIAFCEALSAHGRRSSKEEEGKGKKDKRKVGANQSNRNGVFIKTSHPSVDTQCARSILLSFASHDWSLEKYKEEDSWETHSPGLISLAVENKPRKLNLCFFDGCRFLDIISTRRRIGISGNGCRNDIRYGSKLDVWLIHVGGGLQASSGI